MTSFFRVVRAVVLVLLCGAGAAVHAQAVFRLGIAPHTSARVILEMYQPLRLQLEKALGVPVEVVTAPDFTEFAKRMLHQDYDIAVTTGHQARLAQTDADYLPLLTYSAEFRAETIQMGFSLTRLVAELGFVDDEMLAQLQGQSEVALPTAYACAVAALGIPHDAALLAMLFAWAENQVLVCVKSVPLGQVAGQRILLSLREELAAAARHAQSVDDDEMSNWAPGLSLLSAQHEVQYSRLYRS